MSLEEELVRLRVENVALQSILVGLCTSISEMSIAHCAAVIDAFDHADNVAEAAVRPLGAEGTVLNLRSFSAVVDELRIAVLGTAHNGRGPARAGRIASYSN
jgi:hypothetical protein